MIGPFSEFNIGTYNDHERALHITGGAMLGPDHFHIAIEATPATAARIAAKLKLDPEILNDLLAEKNREIVRLRTILDRVSDAVIRAAVVSRPLPEEFWPAIKS